MSETVKRQWLTDNGGVKVAPYTTMDQIIMPDGTRFENKWQEELENKPYVTPQMFGAIGDGVTDDTNAIKTALQNSDVVLLPKGNYAISETINIQSNKTIIGVSNIKSVISNIPSFYGDLITVDGVEYVTLRNFGIHHNGDISNAKCLVVKDTNSHSNAEHHIIDNLIINAYNCDYGLYTKNINASTFKDLVIIHGNEAGLYISSFDCLFSNIDVNSSKNGIHVTASNNRIDNCKMWYCSENGFYHENGNFNQINNCEAQENGTNGFYFKNIGFSNISILSDTNGRLSSESSNVYIKSSNCCNIKAVSAINSGLNGRPLNQFYLSSMSDCNADLIASNQNANLNYLPNTIYTTEHGLGLLRSNIILNGKNVETYGLNLKGRSLSYPSFFNGIISVVDNGSNKEHYVDTVSNEMHLKERGLNAYNGIKLYSDFIPCVSGLSCELAISGYSIKGIIRAKIVFYNNDKEISSSNFTEKIFKHVKNKLYTQSITTAVPSNANKCRMFIECFSDNENDYNFECIISSARIMCN